MVCLCAEFAEWVAEHGRMDLNWPRLHHVCLALCDTTVSYGTCLMRLEPLVAAAHKVDRHKEIETKN